MDKISFASLKYLNTNNIGDEIQTLAAEQFLPKIDNRFDRDRLTLVKGDKKHITIMNGWYAHSPETSFPPSDIIEPIFVSIHISPSSKKHFTSEAVISYFKKHEPIGCRDLGTVEILKSKGVDAFLSKCLTITFPKRIKEPKTPKTFLVDTPNDLKYLMPDFKKSEKIFHTVNEYGEFKFDIAKKLLDKYRDEAGLVITSRLHCALPCTAMGIPVVLFANPNEYRISFVKTLGLKIYNGKPFSFSFPTLRRLMKINFITDSFANFLDRIFFIIKYKFFEKINWTPEPVDISEEQEKLRNYVRTKVSKAMSDYKNA